MVCSILARRTNDLFLPSAKIPAAVTATNSFEEALRGAEIDAGAEPVPLVADGVAVNLRLNALLLHLLHRLVVNLARGPARSRSAQGERVLQGIRVFHRISQAGRRLHATALTGSLLKLTRTK